MRNIVLIDIDHTLSAAWPRDGMIGSASWDDYHAASVHDDPIHDIKNLINHLHRSGMEIIGLTARPGKWRNLTMKWLLKHGIKMDEILMRAADDFRSAPEVKVGMAVARFPGQNELARNIAFIIDDREDVCVAFKALGVTTLQCHGRRA